MRYSLNICSLITALSVTTLVCLSSPVFAFEFNGVKSIVAVTADNTKTPIGTVEFKPEADGVGFKVALNKQLFTDYFLSMREFKCLPADKEISCYVPYPYQHPAKIKPDDLAWLEHNLLFLYKTPSEYGANLWNGVYYEFQERDAVLVGVPKAVDLNEIAAPTSDTSIPPFSKETRGELAADARWLKEIIIE
jgi:hypothetical protein